MNAYDPFARGPHPVGVRTIEGVDAARRQTFPIEIWYPALPAHAGLDLTGATQDLFSDRPGNLPRRQSAVRNAAAQPGAWPLIVFSHSSGDRRRQSTFLCTHLASHGYLVGALDHSECIAPDLGRRDGETNEQRSARIQGWIANRVPDVSFLLDHMLSGAIRDPDVKVAEDRIGIAGHSFGGWTALAAPESNPRIRAIVALAPAGSSRPPPEIIPAQLSFEWGRDVPTLYLVAENDTALPLGGMLELFERTRATKRMFILRHADHQHFADDVSPEPGHCSREDAHVFTRGLTLAHFDTVFARSAEAHAFWNGDVGRGLALRVQD